MLVHYKHLSKYAHSPIKAHAADACYDLRASSKATVPAGGTIVFVLIWLFAYRQDTLVLS